MNLERGIRWAAVIVALAIIIMSQTVRDYLIFGLTLIVFVYAVTLLAACVVIPSEVADWFRSQFR